MPVTTTDMMMSLDGYTAGVDQSFERPFGSGPVEELERWMFEGAADNRAEVDAVVGAQAYIMGRNMFSPHRGPHDPEWTGWWGPEPPYHAPVFVLSHHERDPIELVDTTFVFVTGGVEEAWERAAAVAGAEGRIDIAGGATTVNQYLRVGLIDEIRVHISPVLLGAGTRLFDGVEPTLLEQVRGRTSPQATHIVYRVRRPG
jgi:dihydrofolate reductase